MSERPPNLDLKRERFRQQMTRSALARQTRLARKTLLEVEEGRCRPRLETAARIAKALNVAVSDIFDDDGVIG